MTRVIALDCACSVKLKVRAGNGKIRKAKFVRCPGHKSKVKALRAEYDRSLKTAA